LRRDDVKKALNIPNIASSWEFCKKINYGINSRGSRWIYDTYKD
jgi:hypothetical protein